MSLAYITHIFKPVYVDCRAEWVDDLEQKRRVWNLFKDAPEPLGYDPASTFISPDHEHFGVLRLIPWRIELISFPAESINSCPVWRSREA